MVDGNGLSGNIENQDKVIFRIWLAN